MLLFDNLRNLDNSWQKIEGTSMNVVSYYFTICLLLNGLR